MKRLIDAHSAKEALEYTLVGDSASMAERVIDSQPTVDAVPVVRCRECKHMIPQSHTRYCTVWNAVNGMGDEGFCNYGKRKEGAK